MPIFRKTKLTPNLHQPQEYRPYDVLEECLELESLIEDMKHEYIYICFNPTNTFNAPLSFLFTKSLLNSEKLDNHYAFHQNWLTILY